jgi:hypothetical protein
VATDAGQGSRAAIVELFRERVSPGTTLGELAELLSGSGWPRDEDVTVVEAIAGKLPVSWTLEDTVFALSLPPDGDESPSAVYLRVQGKVSRDDFLAAVRGGRGDSSAAPILEVGLA